MGTKHLRSLVALTLAAALVACGDDDDPAGPEGTTVVTGEIEAVLPASESGGAPAPARAPGTDADSVSVVTVEADGSLTTVAGAAADAGTYRVEGVPSGLGDLAVVAWVGGRDAGSVAIHAETAGGDTIRPAPIDYETTLEVRAWAEARAAGGDGSSTSSAEVSLLFHSELPELEALLRSDAEVAVVGQGLAAAGETLTAALGELGVELDAEARADLLREAAVAHAEARADGTAAVDAQDDFADAAIDALLEAGLLLEDVVMATAAAATVLDATVEGGVESRGLVISEAVRLNLRARARLAAEADTGPYAELANGVAEALDGTGAAVRGAADAATIRATLLATRTAARTTGIAAAVQILAGDAELEIQAAVAAAAEAAFDAASLDARLQAAADPGAAAGAVSGYRGAVEAAVEDLLVAAQAEASEADVEAYTALFVAAAGGAYVR